MVKSNASFVMVKWEPPVDRLTDRGTHTTESITFPQLCWHAVITLHIWPTKRLLVVVFKYLKTNYGNKRSEVMECSNLMSWGDRKFFSIKAINKVII